jgi:hypothetical protein
MGTQIGIPLEALLPVHSAKTVPRGEQPPPHHLLPRKPFYEALQERLSVPISVSAYSSSHGFRPWQTKPVLST